MKFFKTRNNDLISLELLQRAGVIRADDDSFNFEVDDNTHEFYYESEADLKRDIEDLHTFLNANETVVKPAAVGEE